jgi:hypothetical protein
MPEAPSYAHQFRYLFELFARADRALFLVGGCVRDMRMGKPPKDYDFTTDALPDETRAILRGAKLRAIAVGEAFGTIATSFAGHDVEITTFRVKESYTKGSRHPSVVFGKDLAQDLSRRDLTINAMAMDSAGEVHDPFGGDADLRAGILRAPGGGLAKTQEIFSDDPLRILRVARFIARFGFSPDADTTAAAAAQHATILDVSRERWQMETLQILRGGRVAPALHWLLQVGVLADYLPEVAALAAQPSALTAHGGASHGGPSPAGERPSRLDDALAVVELLPQADPLCRLAGLLCGLDPHPPAAAAAADAILAGLRFSNSDRALLTTLITHRDALCAATPARADVRRLLIEVGDAAPALLALTGALAAARGGEVNVLAQHNLSCFAQHRDALLRDLGHPDLLTPKLPTGLGALLNAPPLNLPRGPLLRRVMDWLRDEVLFERLPNPPSAEACVAAAPAYFRGSPDDLPQGWAPPDEAT